MRSIHKLTILLALASGLACFADPNIYARPVPQNPDWPIVNDVNPRSVSLGRMFIPLAQKFGPFQYSWAFSGPGGRSLQYNYNLPTEKIGEWSRLVTLGLVPVGSTWEEGEAVLHQYAKRLRENTPNVHMSERFQGDNGGSYFMHYTIGGGPLQEEGLQMVWVPFPGTVAAFQLMNRGKRYSPEELGHFRSVAASITQPNLP